MVQSTTALNKPYRRNNSFVSLTCYKRVRKKDEWNWYIVSIKLT